MPKSKDAVLLQYKNVKILRYNYIDDIVYIYKCPSDSEIVLELIKKSIGYSDKSDKSDESNWFHWVGLCCINLYIHGYEPKL